VQSYRNVDELTRAFDSREAADAFVYPTVGWLFIHTQRAKKRSVPTDRFSFPALLAGRTPRKYPHAMEGK